MFPRRWQADTAIRDLVESMLADDDDALAVAAESSPCACLGSPNQEILAR